MGRALEPGEDGACTVLENEWKKVRGGGFSRLRGKDEQRAKSKGERAGESLGLGNSLNKWLTSLDLSVEWVEGGAGRQGQVMMGLRTLDLFLRQGSHWRIQAGLCFRRSSDSRVDNGEQQGKARDQVSCHGGCKWQKMLR